MKKVLYVTTVSRTINAFLVPHIKHLKANGYDVQTACNIDIPLNEELKRLGIKNSKVDFSRNPLDFNNKKAYRQIINLYNKEKFDIVHVHTPVASFITRLALRNKSVKIMYTAHGFHFYKGAPIISWLVYYPLEKLAARWTDVLITINNEDFERASKFKFRNDFRINQIENMGYQEVAATLLQHKNVRFMHGVGIEMEKYLIDNFNKEEYRRNLGIKKDDFLILILAEINKNKNHIQLIKAVNILKNDYPNIKVICAGEGPLKDKLDKEIRRLDLQDSFKFIGFRNDIKELINSSDCVGLFSIREGLGKCLLEAMIVKKPIIATNTRGPKELIEHNNNGFLVEVGDYRQTAKFIEELYLNKMKREKFVKLSKEKVKKYYSDNVLKEIINFHERII